MDDFSFHRALLLRKAPGKQADPNAQTIQLFGQNQQETLKSDAPEVLPPLFGFGKGSPGPSGTAFRSDVPTGSIVGKEAISPSLMNAMSTPNPASSPQTRLPMAPTSNTPASPRPIFQSGESQGRGSSKPGDTAPDHGALRNERPGREERTDEHKAQAALTSDGKTIREPPRNGLPTTQSTSSSSERPATQSRSSLEHSHHNKVESKTAQPQPLPIDPLADLIATTSALKLHDFEPQRVEKARPEISTSAAQELVDTVVHAWHRQSFIAYCGIGNLALVKAIFATTTVDLVEVVDREGSNGTLLAAALRSSTETLQFLHEKGVSITHANRTGRTPLMESALWGCLESVEYLVQHLQPADLEVRDVDGLRAVDFVSERRTKVNALERDTRMANKPDSLNPPPGDSHGKILDIFDNLSRGTYFGPDGVKRGMGPSHQDLQVTQPPSDAFQKDDGGVTMSQAQLNSQPVKNPETLPSHSQAFTPPPPGTVISIAAAPSPPPTPVRIQPTQSPTKVTPQAPFYSQATAYPSKLLPYDILHTYPTGEVDHYVLQKTLVPPLGSSYKAFAVLYRGSAHEHVYAMSGYSQPDHAHVLNNATWSQRGFDLMRSLGMGFSNVPAAESHVEPQLLAFLLDQHTYPTSGGRRVFSQRYNLEPRITINKGAFCVSCNELVNRFERAYPEARVTYRFMDQQFR